MATSDQRISGPKDVIDQLYADLQSVQDQFLLSVDPPRPKATPTRGPATAAITVFVISLVVDMAKNAAYQLWLEDYIEQLKAKGKGDNIVINNPK